MGVWDKTTPAGTANISEGDDRIRELKEALEDALSSHGTFPGGSPSTAPIYVPLGIVATTEMVFYQAAAPTGWTINVAISDRMLLNDHAAGGTTGGSWATGTTGAGGSHTHDLSNSGWAKVNFQDGQSRIWSDEVTSDAWTADVKALTGVVTDGEAGAGIVTGAGLGGATDAESSHTHTGGTHGSTQHNWAKVIIAAKD